MPFAGRDKSKLTPPTGAGSDRLTVKVNGGAAVAFVLADVVDAEHCAAVVIDDGAEVPVGDRGAGHIGHIDEEGFVRFSDVTSPLTSTVNV